MRRWRRRFLPRSVAVRNRGRGEGALFSALLGIGLALLAIWFIDSQMRPILTEMAKASTKNAVTRIVNDAVERTLLAEAISYEDIITFQKDDSGQITAFTSNSVEMNRLRTQILNEIISKVDLLDSKELSVPLGNLINISLLSSQGPLLPVKVLSVASVEGNFSSQFRAAGVNQSYHQIVLDVVIPIKLLIAGGTVETEVTTQVSVAETILVGKVPDTYLQFSDSLK